MEALLPSFQKSALRNLGWVVVLFVGFFGFSSSVLMQNTEDPLCPFKMYVNHSQLSRSGRSSRASGGAGSSAQRGVAGARGTRGGPGPLAAPGALPAGAALGGGALR